MSRTTLFYHAHIYVGVSGSQRSSWNSWTSRSRGTCVCMCVCACVCMCVCACACACVCMCVCACACACVCVCVCVCVHDCAMKIVFTARQKLTVFIMQGLDGQKGRNGPIGDPVS